MKSFAVLITMTMVGIVVYMTAHIISDTFLSGALASMAVPLVQALALKALK